MRSIRAALARLAALVRGHRAEDVDLRAEMAAHLEMETERFLRRGLHPDEARRQALIASGGIEQAAETVREQRGIPWIETTLADVRHAMRHFRRRPLSTVTMVLVLSLGLGTTIVLFTVLESLATMPAPGLARDESLVRIRGTMRMQGMANAEARLLSWPEVHEYAGRTDLFEDVAAYADESAVVAIGDAAAAPLIARVIYTTPNYFRLLDVHPALGTPPAGDAGGLRLISEPTAMISHALWQQHFGAERDVIGRTLRINDMPIEIGGVTPARFAGTEGSGNVVVWVPLAAYPMLQHRSGATFTSRDSMFLRAIARLRDGVSASTATPIVAGLAARATQRGEEGATEASRVSDASHMAGSADVVPMLAGNSRIGDRRDALVSAAMAGGFALLVLLVTCTNVSALMVGLAVARRREIGVRLSLGAPRRRVIRQLLTESMLLALIATVVGLTVTSAGIGWLDASLDGVQLVVDWRVTLAACAVAIITGLLFGISPALHATRVSLGEVLKSSASSVAATRSRLQRALVVVQIALTQPLLVGLGVVVATMASDAESSARAGVAEQIAEIELDVWNGRVSNEERESRIATLVERIRAIPGVVAAMPAQTGTIGVHLIVHPDDQVTGVTYPPVLETSFTSAPKGYFESLGIPIVLGRGFDAGELARTTIDPARPMTVDAVIIGSDLARRLWGSANPLGRRLISAVSRGADATPLVVVGVVDAAAAGPSDVNGQIRVYVPYSPINAGVLARTAGPALPLLDEMRAVVAAEASQMSIVRVETMAQREARARRELLRASGAAAAGGLLALLLSAIGLYAVVALVVGQRTREIGIRTALGAPGGQVVRMFFVRGLALSAIGLALGLPLSMIAIRMISTSLSWPLASSPLLGVAIGSVVLVVASIAVWVPARRASTIAPIIALRTE